MAYFDFPIDELKVYKPERTEPKDFDAFWENTLNETRKAHLEVKFVKINNDLETIDTYDVEFNGFGGQPIKAWFSTPRNLAGKLPCIVEYLGYGGGRGFPFDWLIWPSAGYAHLVMDTRGQGSVWRKGDTSDFAGGANPSSPGFMTQGILDPFTYYYRRLFSDAVRAIEAARSSPWVDTNRIALTGGSQGGGIALAAAGLDPSVSILMADVPFLCHIKRAVEITDSYPYQELVTFCKIHRDKHDAVFQTLSYFDGMNFATRVKAKSLFSVGLMDDVCPPSTVFAAYNHLPGYKEIRIYPYNKHEGGDNFHTSEKIHFIKNSWSSKRME